MVMTPYAKRWSTSFRIGCGRRTPSGFAIAATVI